MSLVNKNREFGLFSEEDTNYNFYKQTIKRAFEELGWSNKIIRRISDFHSEALFTKKSHRSNKLYFLHLNVNEVTKLVKTLYANKLWLFDEKINLVIISSDESKETISALYAAGISDYILIEECSSQRLISCLMRIDSTKNSILNPTNLNGSNLEKQVSMVSHDLKSPLAVIRSLTEIMLDKFKDNSDDLLTYLKTIKNHADSANELIFEVLDEFRFKSQEKLTLDYHLLLNVINDCVSTLHLRLEKKAIKINLNIDKDFYIFADRKSMKQLFTNLIDNSIKFSPMNSTVDIAAVRTPDGEETKITVQDYGKGIPDDQLKTIFYPYKSNAEKHEKSSFGLGLNICRHIVDLHHGKVEIVKSNKGALFQVRLPYVQNSVIETKQYRPLVGIKSNFKKVLLITRGSIEASKISNILSNDGYEILAFLTYPSKEKVDKFNPDYIIFNYSLKEISSWLKDLNFLEKNETNPFIIKLCYRHEKFLVEANSIINFPKIYQPFNLFDFKKAISEHDKKRIKANKTNKDILYVDDLEDNQQIFKYFVNSLDNNFNVKFATNGFECLELMRHENFNFVFLDINMPKLDGWETIKIIREREKIDNRHTQVLACSVDEYEVQSEIKKMPQLFDGSIRKPLCIDELVKYFSRS